MAEKSARRASWSLLRSASFGTGGALLAAAEESCCTLRSAASASPPLCLARTALVRLCQCSCSSFCAASLPSRRATRNGEGLSGFCFCHMYSATPRQRAVCTRMSKVVQSIAFFSHEEEFFGVFSSAWRRSSFLCSSARSAAFPDFCVRFFTTAAPSAAS